LNTEDFTLYPLDNEAELVKAHQNAMDYAALSLPFTVNRMNLASVENRFRNIFKGKLAEHIFESFLKSLSIEADFEAGNTPFWLSDRFDFRWNNYDWDIKNNFVNHNLNQLSGTRKLQLPNLIPDRHANDQWGKWLQHSNRSTKAFVFTFMCKQDIPVMKLNKQQLSLLDRAIRYYQNRIVNSQPFDEIIFLQEFYASNRFDNIKLKPVNMLIGAYCNEHHCTYFQKKSAQVFGENLFKTIITNQFAESKDLPAFKDLL